MTLVADLGLEVLLLQVFDHRDRLLTSDIQESFFEFPRRWPRPLLLEPVFEVIIATDRIVKR